MTKLLKQHRQPLSFEDSLGGSGGRWLREQARAADIVTLGETHASKEIPSLSKKLIEDLRYANEFDYLAIEVSPWTAREMTHHLQKGEEAYNRFIEKYPGGIPFYNFKTERDLLLNVVRESDTSRPLWGLDQLFAFAAPMILDRLSELAPSDSAFMAVNRIRDVSASKSADDPRLQQLPEKIPTPISAFDPVTFDTLRNYFPADGEAEMIIDELVRSIGIYRLNDDDNYTSNRIRARYLRTNLREKTTDAFISSDSTEIPQIVVKVGAAHAYRGLSRNNVLDVGNLGVSLAESMGGEAFNVAVLCGPGSQSRAFPARTVPCWPDYLGEAFKSLAKDQPMLFNMNEIHPKLHERDLAISKELQNFLWAFDAVIIIPNSRPAKPIGD